MSESNWVQEQFDRLRKLEKNDADEWKAWIEPFWVNLTRQIIGDIDAFNELAGDVSPAQRFHVSTNRDRIEVKHGDRNRQVDVEIEMNLSARELMIMYHDSDIRSQIIPIGEQPGSDPARLSRGILDPVLFPRFRRSGH
jgi:hypothetical protein